MVEYKVNTAEPMNGGSKLENPQILPTKVSKWTKVKKFLFQEVKVELTPYQQKVFKEVHDFWHQDITWQKVKDFWLQDIEITL